MRRNAISIALVGLALVLGAETRAADIHLDTLSSEEFSRLVDAVSDAVSFPAAGPAAPLGVVGFDILAVAGGPRVDTSASWWKAAVQGSTVGGVIPAYRLVARKGLPAHLDVGGQYGKLLGQDFWGAEARFALLEGGMVEPALGVRASYTQLANAPLDLNIKEAQLVLSKGFAVITPYAAVGYQRVEASATFGTPVSVSHSERSNRVTGAAGLRLSLIPTLHLMAEARRAAGTAYFVGFGLGL